MTQTLISQSAHGETATTLQVHIHRTGTLRRSALDKRVTAMLSVTNSQSRPRSCSVDGASAELLPTLMFSSRTARGTLPVVSGDLSAADKRGGISLVATERSHASC